MKTVNTFNESYLKNPYFAEYFIILRTERDFKEDRRLRLLLFIITISSELLNQQQLWAVLLLSPLVICCPRAYVAGKFSPMVMEISLNVKHKT